MCLENKVLEKTTCDEYLSLDERLEIAYRRSDEFGPSIPPEHNDLIEEITK